MEGKFLHWRKFAKQDHFRACPLCGKSIQFQLYPDEVGVRILSIALVIGGLYWAKERGGGYVAMFVTVAIVLAVAWYAVTWRLRDKQRFRKPD